ncbi:MAG: pyruvate formate lyase family protein, partial [Coriobacteriales bacterium]
MAWQVNQDILSQIDDLKLEGRLADWRRAMKEAGYAVYVDRQRLFTESWKQTEGKDIEIRRALAFKHICENIPITILPWEFIVGKATPGVVGATPAIDVCGDYMPAIWEESDEMTIGWSAHATLSKEDKEILRESAEIFRNENVADMSNDAVRQVMGDWHDEAVRAHVVDPGLDAVFFGSSSSSCDFPYIVQNGIGSYITRAEKYIDAERAKPRPSADKIYFWQASIICMEGMIELAHRYSDLASQMAEEEEDLKRKAELESIADVLTRVPDKPATSFQEALQSMAIVACGKIFEHPMHNYPHWGRGDQYLYPYFINDVESGKITVKEAGQMLGELIGRWGTALHIMA